MIDEEEKKSGVIDAAPRALTKTINSSSSGRLICTTLEEHWRFSQYVFASGLVPDALRSTEQVFVALQFLAAFGLGYESIRNVMVINQSPSLFGDLPLALVRRSGLLSKFREWLFDSKYEEISLKNKNVDAEPLGAACLVQRVGDDEAYTFTFTVAQAIKAKLWTKSIWSSYASRMLTMRARSLALKGMFGDVLLGGDIYEHNSTSTWDEDHQVIDAKPPATLTDRLNAKIETPAEN